MVNDAMAATSDALLLTSDAGVEAAEPGRGLTLAADSARSPGSMAAFAARGVDEAHQLAGFANRRGSCEVSSARSNNSYDLNSATAQDVNSARNT